MEEKELNDFKLLLHRYYRSRKPEEYRYETENISEDLAIAFNMLELVSPVFKAFKATVKKIETDNKKSGFNWKVTLSLKEN